MRYKEFWIALGLGALAGGVAALLYAPQSGVSARKKLKHRFKEANESLEEVGDYLKKQADRLGDQAQALVNRGKEEAGPAMDTAGDYVTAGTKRVATRARQMV